MPQPIFHCKAGKVPSLALSIFAGTTEVMKTIVFRKRYATTWDEAVSELALYAVINASMALMTGHHDIRFDTRRRQTYRSAIEQ